MPKKVNPRDFLLNTDYELDKIILFKEGRLMPSNDVTHIPHELPFLPLLFGICAFSDDYSDARALPFFDGINYVGTPTPIASYDVQFTTATDGSQIELIYKNTNTSQPINYRIFGFEPTDSNAKVGPTKKYAKTFLFNTNHNYLKLYKKGIVNAGATLEITHNFGYIPQMLAWETWGNLNPEYVVPITEQADYDTYGITVDNNHVRFDMTNYTGLLANAKIHYRIYYDEA